jgi:pyrimidine-specific ribonucleoside hydrolase
MSKKIPCIVDCDPGVDDAFAILYAASHPKLDLLAITTVFGNVGLFHTARNAQLLAGFAKKPIPVAKGHSKAMVTFNQDASVTHGSDGFGGFYDKYKHHASTLPMEDNAVQTLRRLLMDSDEPVVLFPIGPMTNIAALLLAYPEVKPKIRCISFMGGGFHHGNRTATAEFNFLCDPEAAHIVMEAGIPMIMAGLDITDQAYINQPELDRILAIGTDKAKMLYDILGAYASHDRSLHDPVAVMAFIDPEIFEFETYRVFVEPSGLFSAGASIADRRRRANPNHANTKVAMKLDHAAFMDRLVEVLSD